MNKRPTLATALLAAGGLCLAASPANAAVTLNVEADTFTSGLNQTTNYGSNTKINIEDAGANNLDKDRIGFFRFDLSSWTGGTISGATFTLFPFEQISSTPQNFDVYGISDDGASENFAEGTLHWDNSGYGYSSGQAIADSANFSDLVDLGEITGVTPADEGNSVEFSSAALDTFLNNDGNDIASFIVVNTNGTGSLNGFYAKEHATTNNDGATLTLVPEPGSAALVALGMLAAFGRPRRR